MGMFPEAKKHENWHGHKNLDINGWTLFVIYPSAVNPNILPSSHQISVNEHFFHKSYAVYMESNQRFDKKLLLMNLTLMKTQYVKKC